MARCVLRRGQIPGLPTSGRVKSLPAAVPLWANVG